MEKEIHDIEYFKEIMRLSASDLRKENDSLYEEFEIVKSRLDEISVRISIVSKFKGNWKIFFHNVYAKYFSPELRIKKIDDELTKLQKRYHDLESKMKTMDFECNRRLREIK